MNYGSLLLWLMMSLFANYQVKASFSGIDLAPGHGNNNVVVNDTTLSYVVHIAGDVRVSTLLTTCINTRSSRSWGALLSAYNPGCCGQVGERGMLHGDGNEASPEPPLRCHSMRNNGKQLKGLKDAIFHCLFRSVVLVFP